MNQIRKLKLAHKDVKKNTKKILSCSASCRTSLWQFFLALFIEKLFMQQSLLKLKTPRQTVVRVKHSPLTVSRLTFHVSYQPLTTHVLATSVF
jgi:hypothetical protein